MPQILVGNNFSGCGGYSVNLEQTILKVVARVWICGLRLRRCSTKRIQSYL